MSPELLALVEAGRELALDDRYELAHQMLLSADAEVCGDLGSADACWDEEFRRRIDEIESGAVSVVDGTETIRMARERIALRRYETLA